MKNLAIVFICIILTSLAFVSPHPNAATPIHFDDNNTGSYVFHNVCTGEDVDVTFRSSYSFRGTINGQKVILKAHYNEQQEGIGQTTGTKYIGHVNGSDNQSGSMVNGRFLYVKNLSVRMVAPGSGINFSSGVALRYSFNSEGEATSSREQEGSNCQ